MKLINIGDNVHWNIKLVGSLGIEESTISAIHCCLDPKKGIKPIIEPI